MNPDTITLALLEQLDSAVREALDDPASSEKVKNALDCLREFRKHLLKDEDGN